MVEINKSLDGTLDKAISASSQLKKMPGFIQKYMLRGDFTLGGAKKVKATDLGINNKAKTFDSSNDSGIQNLAAQLAGLDKSQQSAVFKMSDLSKAARQATSSLLDETAAGDKLSASLIENALKSNEFSDVQAKQVLDAANLIDAQGNYLVVSKETAQQNLENALGQKQFAAALQNTKQTEQQLAATIVATVIGQQTQTTATWLETLAIDALTGVLALAKQAAIGLGIGILTWVATNAIDWVMNLKSHSEELVDTMNESHDAADQAAKDVEDIQSKLDDLTSSIEAAGAEKIEDIVDPDERERLQAINDMLEAQLELKKQISKDADDKANSDTSAVVNDKSENSIVKSSTQPQITYDSNGNLITVFTPTPEKVTKTESLQEYTAALEETTQKRRDKQVELDQIEASNGKDSKEYKDKKKEFDDLNETFETQKAKVEELSSAVSEQMDGYKTDSDSFAQYKDEYIAGTNAMTAATKALAAANDSVTIDTTSVDVFAEKVRKIKNDMDNGDSQQSDWKMFNGLGAFSGMTGESIINIDKDTANQTDAEKVALEKLHQVADDNGISFENLIGVFEKFGIIQTSNSSAADNYAEQLEKTMGVIDDIQSAYKNCSTAVEEYNKYGYMSVDSLQELLQMDDEYLNTLELVNGKLQINQSAYADLLAAQYADAQMEAISQAISELNAITQEDAAEKTETLTEATEDEKKKLEALCPALKDATTGTGELAGAIAGVRSAENGDNAEEIEAKISSVMNALNTRLSLISTNMQNAMNSANGLKNQLNGFSDSTNKSSAASQTFLDAWSTLTSVMKEFNEQGYLSMQTVQDLTGLEDKYTSTLKKNDITGKLEIQTSKFQELMEAELEDAKIKGDNASVNQYNKILEWTNRHLDKQTMSYWDLVAAIEGYSAALSQAKEITDGFKDAWDNGKTVKQKTEKSRTGALDYEGTEAQSSALQDLLKYSEYDPTLIEKAYNKETGKIDLSGDMLKTAVVESLKQQATAARTEGGAAAKAIAASYEKSAENIENDVISVQDYFDGLGATVDEINEKIDDMQSAWTDLNDVVNEYNTYDGLSVDTLQKLLTMSPEYLACLQLEGGQLSVNADLMKDMLIKQLETKADLLESKDETRDQAKILREMIAQLEKNGISALSGLDQYAKNLEDTLSNIKSLFSDLLGVFEQFNTDKSNDLKIQGDAWLEVIDNRIDALNEANDAQERAIELQKAQDALAKAQANKTVHVYHAGGSGFEWEADQSAVRDAQSTLNDTIRNNRKQDELDRLNKLKDAVQKNNELIGSSFEDYEKKKKYLAEFDKMTYDEMISYNDVWAKSILGNMKSTQTVTNVNNIITSIEKLLTTLQTLNNVLTWIQTAGRSTDGGGLTGLFSENGLLGLVGKFINKASNEGLGAAFERTGSWFTEKLGAALEANPNNPIIKAFSDIWGAVGSGAKTFFSGVGENGLLGTISNGLKNAGSTIGSLLSNVLPDGLAGLFGGGSLTDLFGSLSAKAAAGQTVGSGLGASLAQGGITATTAGSVATGGSVLASIPVVGALAAAIATAVNNSVKQFGKVKNDTKEIWSDDSTSTGNKILKTLGDVVYRLTPLEGIDKGAKYAEEAAKSDSLWDKIKNGAKSLYYGSGLGVPIDNLVSTVKGIFKLNKKDSKNLDKTTSAVVSQAQKGNAGANDEKLLTTDYNSTTELVSAAKNRTLNQMDDMKSAFVSAWSAAAAETGVSQEQIDATSTEMFSKMQQLVDQTYGAIDENAGLSAEQVEDISKSLFTAMQNIYTAGWNNVYATSSNMSQEIADKLNASYKSATNDCSAAMNVIQQLFSTSWEKCGGGVQNLADNTYQTLSKAYAGSSTEADRMLYATRACFDSSWGAVEQGVSELANNPKNKLSEAYAEIASKSNQTFGAEGSLKADADSAWSNVEPGATNLANNMDWVMQQSYLATKQGCSDMVDYINRELGSTAGAFEAVASSMDTVTQKATESEETAKKTGHAWYEYLLNPLGTIADDLTKYDTSDSSNNNLIQNAIHTVTHPISSAVNNVKNLWNKLTGHASGLKSASSSHFANVDELGPELLVRKPQSGRYTYLETGDGVVPADITSKLFEMGGNPNKWFSEQMSKYGSQTIAAKSSGDTSFSTGNIVINNPVGDSEDLANEIKKNFSNKMAQEWNKR